MSALRNYLSDPFLHRLYAEIREAGPIRSVSLDLVQQCNLRCQGCYYFNEDMDQYSTRDEQKIDQWIENEKVRGTNFVTIVGGEPSLALDRLSKLYQNFKINVATNGLVRIPLDGFEEMPIGIAVWGNHKTDARLRINGKQDLFERAKKNYKNDSRAFWYYTVAPGHADQVEQVVEECIQNGNKVLFNYYSDLDKQGGDLDYGNGFNAVREQIERMIEKYPAQIYTSHYLNQVVTTGTLMGERWGYECCTNLSTNYAGNKERLENGNLFNSHFRAYFSDYETTRRCCTGIHRHCDSCFDTWEHFSWIMINLRKHLSTKEDFTNWLFVQYSFYLINRLVKPENADDVLRNIHEYSGQLSSSSNRLAKVFTISS